MKAPKCVKKRPIEAPSPSIHDRQKVAKPLMTGILSIDSMIPIGRGQRELIIGDRQTGKTTIAIDTILNQRDKNVMCVYVAIGQKASTIADVVNTLSMARWITPWSSRPPRPTAPPCSTSHHTRAAQWPRNSCMRAATC